MVTRFSTIVVFFKHPFILEGFGRVAPAGAYTLAIARHGSVAVLPARAFQFTHFSTFAMAVPGT